MAGPRREVLRHNPANAVTRTVERLTDAAGSTTVVKELARPGARANAGPARWAASNDPRHWNYWHREADVYTCPELRARAQDAGLGLPGADVTEHPDGVTLVLEDVIGTPGTAFDLADHVAVAGALGRWQAVNSVDVEWTSRRFLREYSTSRTVDWTILASDAAWAQPLVATSWPDGLRAEWQRLVANSERLLSTSERLPRALSHLDVWVSNEIRRPSGEVVLLDWAFTGDGAIGEDLGNHIPDAMLDLFWAAERFDELDAGCFEAYLAGLRDAGWRGDPAQVRLGVVASCVKYAWLLPLMLARASDTEHQAYHQPADAEHLYRQRGLVLAALVSWCDEALALADSVAG